MIPWNTQHAHGDGRTAIFTWDQNPKFWRLAFVFRLFYKSLSTAQNMFRRMRYARTVMKTEYRELRVKETVVHFRTLSQRSRSARRIVLDASPRFKTWPPIVQRYSTPSLREAPEVLRKTPTVTKQPNKHSRTDRDCNTRRLQVSEGCWAVSKLNYEATRTATVRRQERKDTLPAHVILLKCFRNLKPFLPFRRAI
jgi:hypothetical protein